MRLKEYQKIHCEKSVLTVPVARMAGLSGDAMPLCSSGGPPRAGLCTESECGGRTGPFPLSQSFCVSFCCVWGDNAGGCLLYMMFVPC